LVGLVVNTTSYCTDAFGHIVWTVWEEEAAANAAIAQSKTGVMQEIDERRNGVEKTKTER